MEKVKAKVGELVILINNILINLDKQYNLRTKLLNITEKALDYASLGVAAAKIKINRIRKQNKV